MSCLICSGSENNEQILVKGQRHIHWMCGTNINIVKKKLCQCRGISSPPVSRYQFSAGASSPG